MLEAQLSNLIIWAVLWGATFGFFFLIFTSEDYIKRYIWVSAYFITAIIFNLFVFREQISRAFSDFTIVPLIVLVVVVALQIAMYYYLPKYFKKEPTEYFKRYPKRSYLNFNFRRLTSKSTELVLQQLFIISLTLILNDASLSLTQIVITFAILFGIVHTPLIFIEKWWTSWYFVILSFVASALFPTLILKIKYGFVYGYIVHWVFYTLTTVWFWIWYNKFRKT